jgi:hypothetical protein
MVHNDKFLLDVMVLTLTSKNSSYKLADTNAWINSGWQKKKKKPGYFFGLIYANSLNSSLLRIDSFVTWNHGITILLFLLLVRSKEDIAII